MHNKATFRQFFRQLRQNLPRSIQQQHQRQLQTQLLRLACIQKAQLIAGYWPSDGEISPVSALQILYQQGKTICLPEVLANRQMRFLRFYGQQHLSVGAYGIKKPHRKYIESIKRMDVVLLPLVAFDKQGRRLGMGGGYYDRALAYLHKLPTAKRPVLIGLAHSLQKTSQLPHDSWDIDLDMIVTEKQILHIKR